MGVNYYLMITQQEAAIELLRRREARKDLISFTRYTFPKYRPADHHYLIAQKLEAVERGEIKRLMITMPPRHGKSELASRRFPAWALGRDADKSLISASYNSDLANDFGREVRNIVSDQSYKNVFATELAKDSAAANRWHTNGDGGYVAAGIGTAVTGRGAHIFTIDDPVKDREAAQSEIQQRRAYEWYTSTAYTRLESTLIDPVSEEDWLWDVGGAVRDGLIKPFEGAIVLIQTRWDENDLSGKLLFDMENGADQWDLLSLPAISDGVALWASKYSLERLEEIRRAIGARDFSSLYQQDPTPEDGDYYKRADFLRHKPEDLPKNLNKYGTSDFAVSDDDGDFTEHTVWGLDSDDTSYAMANWYDQTSADVWIETLLDLHEEHKTLMWFGEGGVIRRAVEPFLKKRMRERRVYPRMDWINPIHNKVISGRSFQGRAAQGKISIPYGPEGDRMIEELIKFPNGKNDDFPDTCSLWGRALEDTRKVILPEVINRDKVKRYKFKDEEESSDDWMSR